MGTFLNEGISLLDLKAKLIVIGWTLFPRSASAAYIRVTIGLFHYRGFL